MHGSCERSGQIGLIFVRLKHSGAAINLRRVGTDCFLEALDRANRVVIDYQVEVAAEIGGTPFEQIVFGEWGEPAAAALEFDKTQSRVGGKDCLSRSGRDAEVFANLYERARLICEKWKQFKFVCQEHGRCAVYGKDNIPELAVINARLSD